MSANISRPLIESPIISRYAIEPFPSRRILAAVDSSDQAGWATKLGAALADRFTCTLGLIHVNPYSPPARSKDTSPELQIGNTAFWDSEQFVAAVPVSVDPSINVERFLKEGNAVEEIVKTADDWHADLIVIGTHSRPGLNRLLLGGVAQGAITKSHCPVLCISHEPARVTTRRILIAVDRSERSRWAMHWANSLAKQLRAEMMLMHVASPRGSMQAGYGLIAADVAARLLNQGKQLLQKLAGELPLSAAVGMCVRQGLPPTEIISAAENWGADMIVMGSSRTKRLTRVVLGSTTDAVLRMSPSPVLCISYDPHSSGQTANRL